MGRVERAVDLIKIFPSHGWLSPKFSSFCQVVWACIVNRYRRTDFALKKSDVFPFSALTLLVGRQEGHLACKKTGCWFVGGDILTGDLHVL